jgi:hypothetical protein
MKQLGDRSLHKELDVLDQLLENNSANESKKNIDDWNKYF